jgi:hypothetical protein
VPHQVLCYGWNNAIFLQTMIHGVSQGVKMQFARRSFDILDASPFQIVAEGFSLGKDAVKYAIRRCRKSLSLELPKCRHDLLVKWKGLQLPIFGVLRPYCDTRIRRVEKDIGPLEGAKLLSP